MRSLRAARIWPVDHHRCEARFDELTAGLELDYRNRNPVVILRGVSVMGVPIPNAWLGNLKNVDLVEEFGGRPGFWQSFSAGVETIAIEDGRLLIELKE